MPSVQVVEKQLPAYQFDRFTLRPAEVKDLGLAKTWTLADPDHADRVQPTFWIEQGQGMNAYLLEDAQGPVFFFKMVSTRLRGTEAWLEVHIQFASEAALLQGRTRRGVVEGFRWLENMLRQNGFTGLFFYSNNPQLIYFCTGKRLGFEWDGKRILKRVRDGQAERKEAKRPAG